MDRRAGSPPSQPLAQTPTNGKGGFAETRFCLMKITVFPRTAKTGLVAGRCAFYASVQEFVEISGMKRMPMFLMMLLATAMADGASSEGGSGASKSRLAEDDLSAKGTDPAIEALDAAECSAMLSNKNAA